MKLLVIANRIPALNKKGDQVLAYRKLKFLVEHGHEISVLSFGDLRRNEDYIACQNLESLGVSIKLIKWSLLAALLNIIKALQYNGPPFQCALYKSKEFSSAVTNANFDIVFCSTVRVLENISTFKGKLFIDFIDSMSLNFTRRVSSSNFIKGWIFGIEANRLRKYEKKKADISTRSFVVSSIDQNAIGSKKVYVVPLGVDLEQRDFNNYSAEPLIIFTGNMNYQPNVDAISWFVSKCWGEIKKSIPAVRLVIAGNNPQARVISYCLYDKSIKVTGWVPSITKILKSASIAIAPMQSGSGMQFKILEAMACSVPVVVTSLGLGDLRAKNGQELFVADNAADFVMYILKLLNSIDLQKKIGIKGFCYVRDNHSWAKQNKIFQKLLFRDLEL